MSRLTRPPPPSPQTAPLEVISILLQRGARPLARGKSGKVGMHEAASARNDCLLPFAHAWAFCVAAVTSFVSCTTRGVFSLDCIMHMVVPRRPLTVPASAPRPCGCSPPSTSCYCLPAVCAPRRRLTVPASAPRPCGCCTRPRAARSPPAYCCRHSSLSSSSSSYCRCYSHLRMVRDGAGWQGAGGVQCAATAAY